MTFTDWDGSYPPSVLNPGAGSPAIAYAVAGTPGHFENAAQVEVGSAPANLAALRLLGPLGNAEAWTSGQYVVLGDETEAYWDGSMWEAGRAPALLEEEPEEPQLVEDPEAEATE